MNKTNEDWSNRISTLYKCNYERAEAFEKEYSTCVLQTIKKKKSNDEKIIVICVVKDDLIRISKFVEHYRRLGITHFAFVDNGSTDGTFEYLIKQEDCDVYRVTVLYSSLKRVVWLNRLISIYGTDKWYVMVDSDEFIQYEKMNRISIPDLTSYADSMGIYRFSGYLIDMYPKGDLFQSNKKADFIREYRYFDACGYDIHNDEYGVSIIGGPRNRIFHTKNELAKCPIFKLNHDDIIASAHFLLPKIKAKYNPISLAIFHYKFIDDNDMVKINDAVNLENYSQGSYEYKIYQNGLRENKSFYCKNVSMEYADCSVITKLPYINFPICLDCSDGGLGAYE